eukprot:350051-Chlamydomonas_euryale.AAC.2
MHAACIQHACVQQQQPFVPAAAMWVPGGRLTTWEWQRREQATNCLRAISPGVRRAAAAIARRAAAASSVRCSGVSRPSPWPCKYIIQAQARARARAPGADARVSLRRAAVRVCSDSLPRIPHAGMRHFGATQLSVFFGKPVNASELRKLESRGR